jgi:molecular chaperone HtpG
VRSVLEFDGTPLQSVARGEIDLHSEDEKSEVGGEE